MNLANKSFRDNRTGEIIKVIDSFENIAVLENRTKIDVRRLMDQNLFSEYIDPNQFIDRTTSSAYNSIFETIKSLPTDNMPMDEEISVTTQGSAAALGANVDVGPVAYATTVDDERAELARKYGVSTDNNEAVIRQNQAFAKMLGEEGAAELPPPPPVDDVQRVEVVRDGEGRAVSTEQAEPRGERKAEADPYEMFRGIKRSVEFKLDLPLTNSIPKIEFIEMMEESYDKSIIEFLAHDITQEILRNPDSLRSSIEEKIRSMVYQKTGAPKQPAPKRVPRPNTAQGERVGKKPARKAAEKKEAQK